jgi:O-antigen ligase
MSFSGIETGHGARDTLSERATIHGLAVLLILATWGQGGGHPLSMLVWHGCLVGLLVFTAILPRGTATPRRALGSPALVPFGLFLLLAALGALRAPYRYGAALVMLELGASVALIWLGGRVGSRALGSLVLPLQIAAALQGSWGLWQRFGMSAPRPAGTFLNSNHMSLWLIAVSLFAWGASRAGDAGRDYVWRSVLTLPAAAAVVLSGSRGAALGLAAGAAWLLWVRRRALPLRVRWGIVVAVVLVLALVGWRQLERIERHDPFRYQRLSIWRASASAVADEPFWGSGPGQFASAAGNLSFPDGDGPLRFDRVFQATHSDLVRVAAEFGAPAALALLVALGLAVRTVARRRAHGALPPAADGAVAALVAVAAHGLVDNPSHWPAAYLLASVFVGCLLSEDREPGPRMTLPVRVALGGGLLLGFVVTDVAPYLAWREAGSLPGGRLDEAGQRRLHNALRWNPIHPRYWSRLAEHLASGGMPSGLDGYAASREAAEQAVRLDPLGVYAHRTAAQVEARACRVLFRDEECRARVSERYRRAEERARHDPFLPIALAKFQLDMGEARAGRRAAERARCSARRANAARPGRPGTVVPTVCSCSARTPKPSNDWNASWKTRKGSSLGMGLDRSGQGPCQDLTPSAFPASSRRLAQSAACRSAS